MTQLPFAAGEFEHVNQANTNSKGSSARMPLFLPPLRRDNDELNDPTKGRQAVAGEAA